jgi:hypothetical protein
MEKNEISFQEVQVYAALAEAKGKWLTNAEICKQVDNVSARTVRAVTLKFTRLGLVDLAEVFPAHRYRWSEKAGKRNASYTLRLQNAREVFGVAPEPGDKPATSRKA